MSLAVALLPEPHAAGLALGHGLPSATELTRLPRASVGGAGRCRFLLFVNLCPYGGFTFPSGGVVANVNVIAVITCV